jgi:hypothetical protein
MTMLKEIAAELIGMFMGDARLTLAVLAVVASAAALINLAGVDPLGAGAILLVGCLGLLIENVHRSARRKDSDRGIEVLRVSRLAHSV